MDSFGEWCVKVELILGTELFEYMELAKLYNAGVTPEGAAERIGGKIE